MAFSCTSEERDGAVVVRLSGRLDAAASEDFENALLPRAGDPAMARIVLDGAKLEFVASAGLRVLLKAVKIMQPRGARLQVAGLSPGVLSVLRMSGFMPYVDVVDPV